MPWPLLPMNAVGAGVEDDLDVGVGAEVVQDQVRDVQAAVATRLACVATGRWPALHRVAAELVAHRGDRLHRRAVVLAGDEARVERGGDRGRGDGVVDAGLDGPAALAGVLGVAADLGEAGVVVEGVDQQVEQPRADHGALAPGAEHLGDVVDEVDLLEQLPALGVALHDGVLDAVVDHLGEVAGADLAGVHGAELALGLEGVEGRLDLRDVVGRAAVHQGVAVLQTPHPTGDAAVDEPDALLGQHLAVAPGRRSSGSCRRRRRGRPRRAGHRAR